MSTETTFGRYLLNDKLPDDITVDEKMDKGDLREKMTSYAKQNPDKYPDVIQKVKKFGDKVSTQEGISVGLEDIKPEYDKRDQITRDAKQKLEEADDDREKREILYDTEDKVKEITQNHPSDMTLMAKSGGRGSIAQLMKTVSTPVVASDPDGKAKPWLLEKSYAEGLSPGDAWVANEEARRNVFEASGSVVEPGAMAKVVTNTMQDEVVTERDCGTRNGVRMDVNDEQIVDRYPARSNQYVSRDEVITPEVREKLVDSPMEKIQVRSPMTCETKDGTCKKCMGVDSWGQEYDTGTNVGIRSAHALTEPLTQFVLNAKHGVRYVGDEAEEDKLRGLDGFKVLTEVPKSYSRRAQLAEESGKVNNVNNAPQGGFYTEVEENEYYSPPGLEPVVSEGDEVEKGDKLTKGVPMPDEVVKHKGLGEGRRYLADQINDLYKRQGEDIDRRHAELLAKKAINYVRVEDDPDDDFIPGDVVEYNQIRDKYGKETKEVDVDDAIGEKLGEEAIHYSVGTLITESIAQNLKNAGINKVKIAKKSPEIQPIMKSIERTPLLRDDWMGRLSHRYLKRSLMEGARQGDTSKLRSTNPIPAFVEGKSFGEGPRGKYASMDKEQLQDAYNRCKEAGMASIKSLASKAKSGLKSLFKGTDEGIQATKESPRMIDEWGSLDWGAIEANKAKNWMEGADVGNPSSFFDEKGLVSDETVRQARTLKNVTPASQNITDDMVQQVQDQGMNLSKTDLEDIAAQRGGRLARTGQFLKKQTIGDKPLQILKERYQKGGILGKGGLIMGDLAPGSEFRRQIRRYSDPDKPEGLWDVTKAGIGDVGLNKTLDYGFPGYLMYDAATKPDIEAEERGAWTGRAVGEMVGTSVAKPFGIAGFMPMFLSSQSAGETLGRGTTSLFTDEKAKSKAPAKQTPPSPPPAPAKPKTPSPAQTKKPSKPAPEPQMTSSSPPEQGNPQTQNAPGITSQFQIPDTLKQQNYRQAAMSAHPVTDALYQYHDKTDRSLEKDYGALKENVQNLFKS